MKRGCPRLNTRPVYTKFGTPSPDQVSAEPVEPDWITKFFNEAQDVSDAQMQLLWGKLLAGEITKPGSVSRRTLAIVSSLGKAEASKFEVICSLTAKFVYQPPCPFVLQLSDECASSQGVHFNDFLDLQAAGLLSIDPLGTETTFKNNVPGTGNHVTIERPGDILFLAKHPLDSSVMRNGLISLTSSGCELFNIADWRPYEAHDKHIYDGLVSSGWTVERRKIVGRTPEGAFAAHIPFPYP